MSLEKAWERSRAANRDYRQLLICTRIEPRDDPDSLLSRARNREGDARIGGKEPGCIRFCNQGYAGSGADETIGGRRADHDEKAGTP